MANHKKPKDSIDELYIRYNDNMLEKIEKLEETCVKKDECAEKEATIYEKLDKLEVVLDKIKDDYVGKDDLKEIKYSTNLSLDNVKSVLENYGQAFVKVNVVLENINQTLLSIHSKEKHASGQIKKLEIWQAGAIVGIVIIGTISGYFVNDYINTRDNFLKLQERVSNIDNRFEK